MTFTSMHWLISHLDIPKFEEKFLLHCHLWIAYSLELCPKSMPKIKLWKKLPIPLFALDVQYNVKYAQYMLTLQLWETGVRFGMSPMISPYPQQKTECILFWPDAQKKKKIQKTSKQTKKAWKDCSGGLLSAVSLLMPLCSGSPCQLSVSGKQARGLPE